MQDTSILTHYLEPLNASLQQPDVTEIVVNRPGEVGVERAGGWEWRHVPELTPPWMATLGQAAAAFTAQDIGPDAPICSTLLPGGERCQMVMPPAAEHHAIVVRKPAPQTLDLNALERAGLFGATRSARASLSATEARLLDLSHKGDWPGFFRLAVASKRNILISGATGSGKTTFAKALVLLIGPDERLITIEDVRELVTPQRNSVHLLYAKDGQGLSKLGPKALLESALRMRPDRILLQELRDATAFFYLRNVASGHPGSITTIHADSPNLAFEQLSLLVKESEAGRDMARSDIRALLHQLVDVVVQMRRQAGRYRISEVWYDPHRKHALAA